MKTFKMVKLIHTIKIACNSKFILKRDYVLGYFFFYNYGCDLDLAAWVLLLHCFYSKVVLYERLCPNLTKGKENQA